jgi:hypothetical protein
LDSLLQAPKNLHSAAKNAPSLQLSLGLGPDPDEIVGQLTDGTWVSSVVACRCPDDSPATQLPGAGSYTLIVPGRDYDPASPAGYGFGKARVNRGGVTSLIGILADGSRMSASSVVSTRGWWPFYIALNSGRESLIGWLQFADQADSDVSGTLTWIKSVDPRTLLYGGGFTNQCPASGSTYTPPPRGQPPIDPGGATVLFSGGNLASTFSEPLSFSGTGMSGDGLTGKFSSSSGTFKGVVTDPVTQRPLTFQGAVVQKRSAGYGFVLLGDQTSAVTIGP